MGEPEDEAKVPPAANPPSPAPTPAAPSPSGGDIGAAEPSERAEAPQPLADAAPAEPAPVRQDALEAKEPPQAEAVPLPEASALAPPPPRRKLHLVARHSLTVRTTHWLNAVIIAVMLMSGLQIFNAHPALYWGARSDFDRPLLAMVAERNADGQLIGMTTLFGARFETTGILGVSNFRGEPEARAFPAWITLPGMRWLSMGRSWHFFFAWLFVINGLAYVIYSLARRHVQKDLLPTKDELRHIGRSIVDHARFRFHKGEAARHYNVLQKLAYLGIVFVLGPLVVLTGLSMSPTLNAGLPWLPELFGGRQSARTFHFLCAAGFVAFFLIHIFMVLVSGVWNNIRSMITGRYAIEVTGAGDGH
jgi:thiosulfate reductase cytochrome b subunit